MRRLVTSILFPVLVFTFGCGDDDDNSTSPDPQNNQIYDSLVFTRQGGGTMATGADWAICCGAWETGVLEDNTLKILVYDALGQESGFKLFILVDSAEENVHYALPTDAAGTAPVSMFIDDVSNSNELNSEQPGSVGTIVINSFNCGPPVTLDVSISAILAAETYPNPPITVNGRFVCEIYTNPATFGCEFSF